MRGGTSKGAFFVADDLPTDPDERDDLVLRIVGSPDPRQVDGIGGAHPLTTKVAIVARSPRPDLDVEYLFLQPSIDQALVSDAQNCGNLLAAVGPFALERGLLRPVAGDVGTATCRIHMANTDSVATATFPVVGGVPDYEGRGVPDRPCVVTIDGVPGEAAEIVLDFEDIAGGSCGALLPTGRAIDVIDDVECTLIDNGMPVVVIRAADVGVGGDESPIELESDVGLRSTLESIRLQAGPMMHLGDVAEATIPKITLVSPPKSGGHIGTRTFIPHRVHDAIGVLGAVSVATAVRLPGSPAATVARPSHDGRTVVCEHPTGSFAASVDLTVGAGGLVTIHRAGIVRTARKLMDGTVFPRSS